MTYLNDIQDPMEEWPKGEVLRKVVSAVDQKRRDLNGTQTIDYSPAFQKHCGMYTKLSGLEGAYFGRTRAQIIYAILLDKDGWSQRIREST
jgi:hypothetical protein